MTPLYDADFFDKHDAQGYRSACGVVPILLQLVQPKSVVDFGCGSGMWLRAFADHGITDGLGLDGEWVQNRPKCFRVADLNQPVELPRSFDLAVSLEVAEHLANGDALIESLTKSAPVVLFSAAIPDQGGDGHVNEQWPDYWSCIFRLKRLYSC